MYNSFEAALLARRQANAQRQPAEHREYSREEVERHNANLDAQWAYDREQEVRQAEAR